jgi:SecD/SecF fusion protein
MTRPPVLRALLALLILGITGYFAVAKEPRLGLDLRGGTSITLETKDSPVREADAEATDRALEVLRRRVDALGVAEPTLARSGANRIIVELPGVQDAAQAAKAIGQTAQLTFHPVLGPGDPSNIVGLQPDELPDTAPSGGPTVVPPSGAPSAAPSKAAVPSPAASAANGRAVPPALATQAQPSPAAPLPTATATRAQLIRWRSSPMRLVIAPLLSNSVRRASRISAMRMPRTSSWLSYCQGSVRMTT